LTVSDKIGSLEWLSVWDLGPVWAFWATFGVQFVLVNVLMAIEGHFGRGRYLSFLYNNGLLIPLYVAMVTVVLQKAGASDAWYTQTWWHMLCLFVPVVIWIIIDKPSFTTAQYFSPSKLGHTLTMIPMGYWLIAPAPAFFATFKPVVAVAVVLAAIAGCLYVWATDEVVYLTDDKADPHVEWDWSASEGTPRYVEITKRGIRGGN